MEAAFGKAKKTEIIRTEILFRLPYGDIAVPDIALGQGLRFCVARMPDEDFYEGAYWVSYGPKPSDGDPDVFVVPVTLEPYQETWAEIWQRVMSGCFVTTESGVIVLDVGSMFAWEGYERPGKRNYGFDRRRLEKSAAALKAMVLAS